MHALGSSHHAPDSVEAPPGQGQARLRDLRDAVRLLQETWSRRRNDGEGVHLVIGQKMVELLAGYGTPWSISHRLHRRRIGPLLAMIEDTYVRRGEVRIVDVGGVESYWDILPEDYRRRHNVSITILNLPDQEMPDDHQCFSFVPGDGCCLDGFGEESFDIAHSNSVIEHVGDWHRMEAFASEIRRVGRSYFVQTPDFWFPLEPHFMAPFFHWLPRTTRVWLFMHVDVGFWSRRSSAEEACQVVDSIRLLDRRSFRALFSDADVLTERLFGMPKSLIAVRRAPDRGRGDTAPAPRGTASG